MKLTPALFLLTVILLCSCGNKDKKGSSSSKEVFTADTTHKPYTYAQLHYSEKGVALTGKYAAGIAVAILDNTTGKVHTCTTTAITESVEDDMEGGAVTVTHVDKPLSTDTPFNDMLAILNYSGQPYSLVGSDTIRDAKVIDSLKRLIINSGALKKLYTETNETRKFDAYAKRLFEKAKLKTPNVVELHIPGLSTYLISYVQGENYDPENDSWPSLIVINGKAYTAAGPCGGVSSVYKLGNNYFINSGWLYCEGDVGGQVVLEIRADGLKEEVTF
jgi:hypothetical protein